MTEPYIPTTAPFYAVAGFRVWETATGFLAARDRSGDTYRGDLAGCARWIARQTVAPPT